MPPSKKKVTIPDVMRHATKGLNLNEGMYMDQRK